MYSDTGNTTSLVLGFPIRTSSDQRSVGSSPRHIAASHVLHRPLMPRHPPCALKHLQHKNQLFNIKNRNYTTTTHNTLNAPTHIPAKENAKPDTRLLRVDARNHYPRIKHHTPPPKPGATTRLPPPHRWPGKTRACCLKAQQCVWWSAAPRHQRGTSPASFEFVYAPEPAPTTGDESIQRIVRITVLPRCAGRPDLVVLLRKEVIQPHLPVRLPCYDFVPIADPTFDGSLPRGVRPPASGVTDFHDVTGGVYKARERIHRSVADLRLLATPTSRGRVADPDPN